MVSVDTLTTPEDIRTCIVELRNKRVVLDVDLARLYGATTSRLNEQIRRNRERFPADFMFRLTASESDELIANCDRFSNFKHLSQPPLAFTEHGAIMAANVLRSARAIEMSVIVVRAFVQMRELALTHKDLIQKIDKLEQKYDSQFKVLFDAIRELMTPSATPRRKIGF